MVKRFFSIALLLTVFVVTQNAFADDASASAPAAQESASAAPAPAPAPAPASAVANANSSADVKANAEVAAPAANTSVPATPVVNASNGTKAPAAQCSNGTVCNGKKCSFKNFLASLYNFLAVQHPVATAATTATAAFIGLYNYNDNFKNSVRLMFGMESLEDMAERCGCNKPRPTK